ncbi:hypothetical protein TCARB_1181 [Thermofilum adornatum 1505]|uniref:Uncharacterized protein n=1 Tax=Thermofilum adornatum 1505 TaxID=697581 RepID=A0A3G1A5S7_9CREN|nr:hypothetical protein TCARB_1181 [Thermofilum adornatum 1505]
MATRISCTLLSIRDAKVALHVRITLAIFSVSRSVVSTLPSSIRPATTWFISKKLWRSFNRASTFFPCDIRDWASFILVSLQFLNIWAMFGANFSSLSYIRCVALTKCSKSFCTCLALSCVARSRIDFSACFICSRACARSCKAFVVSLFFRDVCAWLSRFEALVRRLVTLDTSAPRLLNFSATLDNAATWLVRALISASMNLCFLSCARSLISFVSWRAIALSSDDACLISSLVWFKSPAASVFLAWSRMFLTLDISPSSSCFFVSFATWELMKFSSLTVWLYRKLMCLLSFSWSVVPGWDTTIVDAKTCVTTSRAITSAAIVLFIVFHQGTL